MKVCVQGLWHLGSVTAACLAARGHSVTGLDRSPGVADALARGIPPLFEPGLEELVKDGLAKGNLRFTADVAEAARGAQVLWVCHDTPVDEDDRSDVEFVVDEIAQTLPHLDPGVVVLISSQMPVGSVRRLEALAADRAADKRLAFAISPENLRLGKAIDVFLNTDRIVVGVRQAETRDRIASLLEPVTARIEWMSVESAEMTKHAINAFLATSVTFANEIASICEQVGADAKEVERGLKTEARIGPKAYLSPGAAFAGGTLARDVAFLNAIGAEGSLVTPLLSSVRASNEEHKQWAKRRLRAALPDLSKATVAIWGLTYKPGTDTLRRSTAVEFCDWLVAQGAAVRVHDPAVKELPETWRGSPIQRFDDCVAALAGAQALVVCTEWPEYRAIAPERIAAAAPGLAVIDANRFLSSLGRTAGIRYAAVGTPQVEVH
jgi:UDPglucose 6-dehydrogenase